VFLSFLASRLCSHKFPSESRLTHVQDSPPRSPPGAQVFSDFLCPFAANVSSVSPGFAQFFFLARCFNGDHPPSTCYLSSVPGSPRFWQSTSFQRCLSQVVNQLPTRYLPPSTPGVIFLACPPPGPYGSVLENFGYPVRFHQDFFFFSLLEETFFFSSHVGIGSIFFPWALADLSCTRSWAKLTPSWRTNSPSVPIFPPLLKTRVPSPTCWCFWPPPPPVF